jgi:CheY-like chemotaxis protein
LQAQLTADERASGPRQDSVVEWLELHAGTEGLRGVEREQTLLAAKIRHRVRNVLSLLRSTLRLSPDVRSALAPDLDELLTDALLLRASASPQGTATIEQSSPAPARPHQRDLAGCIVLVVEDDYFIAEELCRTLREGGAEVVGPAPDVDHGRSLMDRQPLDCAVLDVNLQGEHVFQLAHELRARKVPIIFTTGYDREFLPHTFRDSAYLQKPVDAAALLSAVRGSSRMRPERHN